MIVKKKKKMGGIEDDAERQMNSGYVYPYADTDEERAIDACIKGDWSEFRRIFEKYRTRVYTLAASVLKDRELAADAAQESFIRVFKSLERFDRRSRFATWLYRITYNTALDYYRKERRKREHETGPRERESAESSHFQEISRGEARDKLKAAIEALPVKLRAVVHMKYAEGLSYSEICVVTGCARGVLQKRLGQAEKKLRETLQREIAEWRG